MDLIPLGNLSDFHPCGTLQVLQRRDPISFEKCTDRIDEVRLCINGEEKMGVCVRSPRPVQYLPRKLVVRSGSTGV